MENQEAIYQIKFNNKEEIVATVLEWSFDGDILIKDALIMKEYDTNEKEGIKSFTFKPWMMFQDELQSKIHINPVTIISYFSPSEYIKKSYLSSVKDIYEFTESLFSEEATSKKDSSKLENVVPLFRNIKRKSEDSDGENI